MYTRVIMTAAWNLAQQGAARFGGKASLYLREALRIIWKETRDIPVYRQGLGTQLWMGFAPLPGRTQRGQWSLPGIIQGN